MTSDGSATTTGLSNIFARFHHGDVVLVKIVTGEALIAVFEDISGMLVRLRAPRVLKLEHMNVIYAEFLIDMDDRQPCCFLLSTIIAVGEPSQERAKDYSEHMSKW